MGYLDIANSAPKKKKNYLDIANNTPKKDIGEIIPISTFKKQGVSRISQFVRGLMRTAPSEQAKTTGFLAKGNMPDVSPGETLESYRNRVSAVLKPREEEIVSGGTLPQLSDITTASLGVAGLKNPLPIVKGLAKFGVVSGASKLLGIDKAISKIENPTVRDVADIAKVGVEGSLSAVPWRSTVSKMSPVKAYLQKKAMDKVDSTISNTFNKAIKPLVRGKQTLSQIESYKKDANIAIKDIVSNKGELEKLPENIPELAQASKTRMDNLVNQWQALEKSAGAGNKPKLHYAINEIRNEFVKNKAYSIRPDIQKYAEDLSTQLWQSPRDIITISKQIKILNDTASKAYGDPASIGKAQVDAFAAKSLRKVLDNVIENATGKSWQGLRNLYKSHKAIEKDINNAVLREAKKLNPGGLSDLLASFGDGDMVAGLITLNPTLITKGIAQKSALGFMKWLNNPNRRVKDMFKVTDEALSNIPTQAINRAFGKNIPIRNRVMERVGK